MACSEIFSSGPVASGMASKVLEKHRCVADAVQAVLFPNGTHVPASKLIVPGQAPQSGRHLKAKSVRKLRRRSLSWRKAPTRKVLNNRYLNIKTPQPITCVPTTISQSSEDQPRGILKAKPCQTSNPQGLPVPTSFQLGLVPFVCDPSSSCSSSYHNCEITNVVVMCYDCNFCR